MRRWVALALSIPIGACGSSQPAARTAAEVPRLAQVQADEAPSGSPAPASPHLDEPVRPGAADRVAPTLERARILYRDLAFELSLAAVGEAQIALEGDARTEADFDALHLALLYRAMNELALAHPDRARDAVRAALAIRPEAELDEGRFPPDLRALHVEVREALRVEEAEAPRAEAPRGEAPRAEVAVDTSIPREPAPPLALEGPTAVPARLPADEDAGGSFWSSPWPWVTAAVLVVGAVTATLFLTHDPAHEVVVHPN